MKITKIARWFILCVLMIQNMYIMHLLVSMNQAKSQQFVQAPANTTSAPMYDNFGMITRISNSTSRRIAVNDNDNDNNINLSVNGSNNSIVYQIVITNNNYN